MTDMTQGKSRTINLMLGCCVAVGALVSAAPAFAQDSAPAPEQAQTEEAGVGDIIVTANRREERLQDVPVAITAFDSGMLAAAGISSTNELTQVTPGLNFTQYVYSPQPTIRGIGVRGVAAGDESTVPIYVDGAYQSFLGGQNFQFNDIERIEVLKGPQGALFGRNATGGAVNVITKTPSQDLTGSLSLSYGRFNEVVAKGYASVGSEKVAGSVAFVITRDDGYIYDFGRDDKIGSRDDFSTRAKLYINQGGTFELRLAGSYTRNKESTGEAYRPFEQNTTGRRVVGNPYGIAPYTSSLSYDPRNNLEQYTGTVTAILRLDPVTVTSLTAYQYNTLDILADSDGTRAELATIDYTMNSKNLYHETYFTSEWDGPLQLVGGLVYFHDHSYYPFYQVRVNGAPSTDIDPHSYTDSYAAYLQATYALTDTFSVIAGGRYTKEKRRLESVVTRPLPGGTLAAKATFSKFTPSLTLQYQPSSSLNLYAKYGEAFKSGLFAPATTNQAALRPVQPENVKQYEIGLKSDITPWLRINLAGYYTDYKDMQNQARDPVTLLSILQNAGSARIYGGEFEAVIKPSSQLTLRTGVSALSGKFKNFTNAQVTIPATTVNPVPATACVMGTGPTIGGNRTVICDVSGNRVNNTPFFTANVGGNYTAPVGDGEISLSGNLYYSGHSYWDTFNRLREPSKLLANAEIGWKPGPADFRISLWGENLFNEQYSLTLTTSGTADSQVLAQPRTYGVRLDYSF